MSDIVKTEEKSNVIFNLRYSPTCKVCNSPHVEEIHKMRLQSKTYKEISEFLKNNYDENISEANLSRHFKYHYVISEAKRREILHKTLNITVPTVAIVPSADIDVLIEKDIDYVSNLKVLLHKKLQTLSSLQEKVELIESGDFVEEVEFKEQLELYKLIQSVERDLAFILEKIDRKKKEYLDISLLRDFILQLIPLINELEEESNEKRLIEKFREKVSLLIKSFDNEI